MEVRNYGRGERLLVKMSVGMVTGALPPETWGPRAAKLFMGMSDPPAGASQQEANKWKGSHFANMLSSGYHYLKDVPAATRAGIERYSAQLETGATVGVRVNGDPLNIREYQWNPADGKLMKAELVGRDRSGAVDLGGGQEFSSSSSSSSSSSAPPPPGSPTE
jgi:hypothetical protein